MILDTVTLPRVRRRRLAFAHMFLKQITDHMLIFASILSSHDDNNHALHDEIK